MRKASKANIAANLAAYAGWREKVDARLAGLPDDARQYLGEWADDVRGRIDAGELGVCTQALIDSVERDIRGWESGFFSHVAPNGGRVLA